MLRGIAHIRHHETDRLAALARELGGLGADVAETEDGLAFRPAPLHGGLFHTYADHRMAHAGVVVGSAVDEVLVEDVGTTSKTYPGFPTYWSRLLGPRAHREPGPAPLRRGGPGALRPTATPHPPAHQGAAVVRRRARRPGRSRSTAAASALLVDEHPVTAMKARPLGRKAVVVGDRVRVVGDVTGDEGSLARIVEVGRPHDRPAAQRRRRRHRSSG